VCSVCWRMLEVVEAMRCVLLCMLEAVVGVLCSLEDVGRVWWSVAVAAKFARDAGGDALSALSATLYVGG